MQDVTRIIMPLNMPRCSSLEADRDPYQQPLSGGPFNYLYIPLEVRCVSCWGQDAQQTEELSFNLLLS